MGHGLCAMGQSGGKHVEVRGNRRRLLVGRVDGEAGPGVVAGEVNEDDRAVINGLDEQSIIDMVGGGRARSISSESRTTPGQRAMQSAGDALDPAALGLGHTCRKGSWDENQDSWSILTAETHSLYAIFDGHGGKGHDVSNFVKDSLPKLILKDTRFKTNEQANMISDVFKKTQSLVTTSDRMGKLSAQMSGTTATVCIHDHNASTFTLAHVGNSLCVVALALGTTWRGLPLMRAHDPTLKEERSRIERNGGRIVFDGHDSYRVYARNAHYPGLDISRTIGDLLGHLECGITAEPEVVEGKLAPEHKALLLCTNGVWEFIEPTDAVTIVMQFPPQQAMAATERLAKEAWDRWIREEGGAVVDDITVVLVRLDAKENSAEGSKTNSV
uniref:PPM-type phosphatase domain-containing protein n=1 Tax=Zooxanthella nutricula TaxID=1333877 RepID=A0A6U9RL89_9DINO